MKELNKNPWTLYHGSENIIKLPVFGGGKVYNDYGQGFYTTLNKSMAGEWAVLTTKKDGYINEYEYDYTDLNILRLDETDVKHWIALLMEYREGNYRNPLVYDTIKQFKALYSPDISNYDIIIGWRADDSYFRYVQDFALGLLSIENLMRAIKFGNLGTQVCLKSEEAFNESRIKFKTTTNAEMNVYYEQAETRDKEARTAYYDMAREHGASTGTLIRDLLKGVS
jgi:hypothetical protein